LGLGVSVALGFVSVAVLWGWARWHKVAFDPGELLAVLAPPVLYFGITWTYYSLKAPTQLFEEQQRTIDQYNPPTPWVVAVDVAEEERRITIQLLLGAYTGTARVDSATCLFDIGNIRTYSDTPKSGAVSRTEAIEWEYPKEFTPKKWPLPSGHYEVLVKDIRSEITGDTSHGVGGKFDIGKPKWRQRRRALS
jgi:hypothetical protein